jgi:hypothetical protein
VTFLAVVGVVCTVRSVVGVTVGSVVVTVFWRTVVVVLGSVVVGSVVVGSLVVVVGFAVGRVVVSLCAAFAAYPTKSADVAHDPKKIAWVTCRTRANRRSRCCGVR